MVRIKFTSRRLRTMRGDGNEGDEFNFKSDKEDLVSTIAAVAAVETPGDKLSVADTSQQHFFNDVNGTTSQSAVKSWKSQRQWKKPRLGSHESQSRVEIGIKPRRTWLEKTENTQRHNQIQRPLSASRLAVVKNKRGNVGLPMYSNSCRAASSACAREKIVELQRLASSQADKACVVERPKLVVMRGDPMDWKIAAIVSDANSLLHHNSGLAATIVRNGGLEIQRQSTAWVCSNGEVPVGSAMWTTAGILSSRFIIFTVSPDVSHHRWPTPQHQLDLRRAVRSALNVAKDLGVTSVAIPAICTGLSRYPKYLAAREIVTTCLKFCDECPSTTLRLIALMNEDEVTTSIFAQAMKEMKQQRKSLAAMSESALTL